MRIGTRRSWSAGGTGEGGGDAREGAQDVADCRPTCGQSGLGPACPEDLDRLIGDDGDEEMSIGAMVLVRVLVMIDRPQTELGREGAEDGFSRIVCVREHRIRLSHGVGVPVETIRPQAVHTGLVQHGPFGWVKGPCDRHRPRVCRIGCDGDIVVLGDPDARIKAFASHGAVRSCAGCRPASSGSGVSRDRHGGRAIPLRTDLESG